MKNGFHPRARRSSSTALVAALVAVAAALVLQACGDSSSGADPVAVWDGGKLEPRQYESWLESQNMAPSRESARNLALIVSMAGAARGRGMADSAEVSLSVEAMRQARLLPVLKRHIDAQVEISDAELDQLANENPDAFQRPRKLSLRGIYKRLPPDDAARDEVRREMLALRAQVLDGADIKPLAVNESESQNRFREGSIGWVDPDALPAPVRDAVKGLEIGEVSELIGHAGGLAFYVCERIRPAVVPDSEEVRSKFRQNLFRQRSAELNKALVEKLAPNIRIRLDEDPVLQAGRQALPVDWLDDLIRLRLPEHAPDALIDRQKQRLLREWGLRVAMTDHTEGLGLVGTEELAEAMRWNVLHALATAELRYRVDARMQPPADSALRALYEQRGERMRNPPAYRIAAIQFAGAADRDDREIVSRARDAVARIRSGALEFSQAARDLSVHPSANNGGSLGWMNSRALGGLEMSLLKPVRVLSPGEDSGLLRTPSGLWLVKLLERRAATPMTFEQARVQLKEVFERAQIERLESEVRDQHLADINLRILADGYPGMVEIP
ncbi:MAG: peptidylprolyl isomerase [Xanthomonadaceae bacterium]|nr:peptidylprolyl isomerase [Xanthomonadaceae bacterium]